MLIIFCAVLGVIVCFIFIIYNFLKNKIKAIENSKQQIDLYLDARFKIFEILINLVKKNIDYENTVLKEIVQLRSYSQRSKYKGDTKSQLEAEGKITKITNIIFESYPELKLLDNISQFKEQISIIENKLNFAKQTYNLSVEDYKKTQQFFLGKIVVLIFSKKLNNNFTVWKTSSLKAQNYEDINIH